MIFNLVRNEFSKYFNMKQITFLIIMTIMFFLIFLFNDYTYTEDQAQNTYQEDMEEWLGMAGMMKEEEDKFAPYQKEIYMEYKNVIEHRVETMKSRSEDENSKAIMKAQFIDSGYQFVEFVMFIFAVCFSAMVFAGEYANQSICQTLIVPIKRGKILFAKIIMISIIMLAYLLYFYSVMQAIGIIRYGFQSIPYAYVKNGEVLQMSFYLYYFLLTIFQFIQFWVVAIFSAFISVLLKRKVVTIISSITLVCCCMAVGKFGELLGAFWYNFIPTVSFDLIRLFFRVPLIGEIETLQAMMIRPINITYNNIFMISYDIVLVILLCLSVRDAFVKQDILL